MKGCGEFAKDLKYLPRVYCSPRFSNTHCKKPAIEHSSPTEWRTDRVPRLKAAGIRAKEKFSNTQIACRIHAYENGSDKPEIVNWKELF